MVKLDDLILEVNKYHAYCKANGLGNGFVSKFFGNNQWIYSSKENMRRLLWLEEIKAWMRDELGIQIGISFEVDYHDTVTYYTDEYSPKRGYASEEGPYTSYEDALLSVIYSIFKNELDYD